jgi:poly(A) polymerase
MSEPLPPSLPSTEPKAEVAALPAAGQPQQENPRPESAPAPAGAPVGPQRRRRRRRRGGRSGGEQGPRTSATAGPALAEAAGAPPSSGPEADAAAPGATSPAPAAEVREPVRSDSSLERPTAASVRDDGAPADIDPARLDVDGIKILNRLHRFGHEAYFVGGCVRDLMIGRTPKDHDIATSAHPGEVRSLFRNCRLIGRRFRLAHVFFRGGKLIEVATFRANPTEVAADLGLEGDEVPDDLLITRDNVFGTAEEDARRRDFTINGLFYDIRLGRVIDFVDGRPDLEKRTIRTIGNPEIRMREDPVRILRAVRFAARMNFDLDPQTYAAMEGAVEDLPRCAPARVLEEVFRLLRGGTSREAFRLLHALGALQYLLPPVAEHLARSGPAGETELFARLGALDIRIQALGEVDDSVIIAALLAPLTREAPGGEAEPPRAAGEVVDAVLEQMVQLARLPRRIADRSRQLLWGQGVLLGERRRRRSLNSFRHHPLFRDAMFLVEIGAEATGQGAEIVARFKAGMPLLDPPPPPPTPAADLPAGGEARKRKRRRGGKGRKKRTGAEGSAEGGSEAPPSAEGGGEAPPSAEGGPGL